MVWLRDIGDAYMYIMRICTESEKKGESYLPYLIKESRTSINENVVR